MIRIVLEALGVTLSKKARCRALQLPGVERGARPAPPLGPAVVAAHPADPRLRDRSAGARGPLRRLRRRRGVTDPRRSIERGARAELSTVLEMGGAVAAVENAYMKQRLVESHTARLQTSIEAGDIHGGRRQLSTPSPSPRRSLEGEPVGPQVVDESAERQQIERLEAFRARSAARTRWRGRFATSADVGEERRQRHAALDPRPPTIGVTTGRVGRRAARAASASTAPPRASANAPPRRPPPARERSTRARAGARDLSGAVSGDRSRSSWASRAWTATATARSRSP